MSPKSPMGRTRILLLATAALVSLALLGVPASPRTAGADEVRADVAVFYDSLASYGDWVTVEPYGWVWVPTAVDTGWRPYVNGYWAWSDVYGWTWISNEDWGWAVYHYGRWAWVADWGWVWVPGVVWAPAWVSFRFGDGWIGWAPRPPEIGWRLDAAFELRGLTVDVAVGTWGWSFVPVAWFAEPDVATRVAVTAFNPSLFSVTAPATRLVVTKDVVVNQSVPVATVEKARGKPVPHVTIEEAATVDAGRKPGSTHFFKPRLAPPTTTPPKVKHATVEAGQKRLSVDEWATQRRQAIEAYLASQRRVLDGDGAPGPGMSTPPTGIEPKPGPTPAPGMSPEELTRRRDAAKQALDDERRRMLDLLERQRRRRAEEEAAMRGADGLPPPGPPPQPPGMGKGMGD